MILATNQEKLIPVVKLPAAHCNTYDLYCGRRHVVDRNSRYVQHNIYKSDVYSAGLVLLQLALM
jgi:hypothetical protein